jgi:hypothetical protein
MKGIEDELRDAIDKHVAALSAPPGLAERARRAGRRQRRTRLMAAAGVAVGTVAAVTTVPFLISSTTDRLTPQAHVKPTRTTPVRNGSPALCGPEAKSLSAASPPGYPLPGLEVTYLPGGATRPYARDTGRDRKNDTWMYGARFENSSDLSSVGVWVICGPVARDLRTLLQWRGGASMYRTTVVRGKPALRHVARPASRQMWDDVLWIERPDIAIWIQTGTEIGRQLDAIVNGIRVTG